MVAKERSTFSSYEEKKIRKRNRDVEMNPSFNYFYTDRYSFSSSFF